MLVNPFKGCSRFHAEHQYHLLPSVWSKYVFSSPFAFILSNILYRMIRILCYIQNNGNYLKKVPIYIYVISTMNVTQNSNHTVYIYSCFRPILTRVVVDIIFSAKANQRFILYVCTRVMRLVMSDIIL